MLAFLVWSGTASAAPLAWKADTRHSNLVIHVDKKGIASPVLHDHDFVPSAWQATVVFDPEHPDHPEVAVTVANASLHDTNGRLSAGDREQVNEEVRSTRILDARRYPDSRFVARLLEIQPGAPFSDAGGSLRGTLVGDLTVHGRTLPLRIPIAARWSRDALRVDGEATFPQSAFGIRPYRRYLGTVAVRDRVNVRLQVLLVPAGPTIS